LPSPTGAELRRLLAGARVARLATVTADGRPHVVPVCFALDGHVAYSAVDAKPKRTQRLQRLANVQATGRAALLADHYEEDWRRLWWVRADGRGRLVAAEDERGRALALLAAKYDQYRAQPPAGAVLAVDVERWSGWSASELPDAPAKAT
jgi:PPOX class probable F420-dependent enzyme